jgi:hypothetical protein
MSRKKQTRQNSGNRAIPTAVKVPEVSVEKDTVAEVTEANRRRGPGTKEKVNLRRINLKGNTHVQESNASQLPV